MKDVIFLREILAELAFVLQAVSGVSANNRRTVGS